jgi:hypothetical protein
VKPSLHVGMVRTAEVRQSAGRSREIIDIYDV